MDRNSAILDFFRGIMIGITDLFPGMSGGTIALIMGIYKRLMKSLSSFNKGLLLSLFRAGNERRDRIRDLDLSFLLPLLTGMGIAIFLGARGTSYLIHNHPIFMMSFFLGLLLISLKIPWKMVEKKNTRSYVSLFIGILAAVSVASYGDGSLPSGSFFIGTSGFIAVSFMLLPGVSGSSALLLLGTYDTLINAVSTLDFAVLLPFVLGAALGVIFITRLLNRMLRNHHDVTMSVLTGLLAGSMIRVWPIRSEPEFAEGIPLINTGIFSIEVVSGIALGVAVIILSERIGNKMKGSGPKHST